MTKSSLALLPLFALVLPAQAGALDQNRKAECAASYVSMGIMTKILGDSEEDAAKKANYERANASFTKRAVETYGTSLPDSVQKMGEANIDAILKQETGAADKLIKTVLACDKEQGLEPVSLAS